LWFHWFFHHFGLGCLRGLWFLRWRCGHGRRRSHWRFVHRFWSGLFWLRCGFLTQIVQIDFAYHFRSLQLLTADQVVHRFGLSRWSFFCTIVFDQDSIFFITVFGLGTTFPNHQVVGVFHSNG